MSNLAKEETIWLEITVCDDSHQEVASHISFISCSFVDMKQHGCLFMIIMQIYCLVEPVVISWMFHLKWLTMKSEFHIAAAATGWRLEVERKNSSDEHILIVLVTQSYYATSDDSWPLTFDPSGHFKEGIQEKNSHNRPDCSKAIDSVGDGRAVEYYFASDARSDTNCLWVLWWIWGQIIKFLSFFVIV